MNKGGVTIACVLFTISFLNTGAGEQENFIEISYSYVKFLTT